MESVPSSSSSTPAMLGFNFGKFCFICEKSLDHRHKKVHILRKENIKNKILHFAETKGDEDGWALINRLKNVSSLINVNASYHKKCYDNLMSIERTVNSLQPANKQFNAVWENLCSYIETSEASPYLLSDLKSILGELCPTTPTVINYLKERYGNDIFIIQHPGRETLIFYKNHDISKFCTDWFFKEDSVGNLEKKTIVRASAEILRCEILKNEYTNGSYPPAKQFLNGVVEDIPPLLTYFLSQLLFNSENDNKEGNSIKRNSIAHSIVSIIRPKSFISTLQLSIGTYIYRKTGSKLVINLLSKVGVCASYHHVQLYEASVIMDPPKCNIDNPFVQFAFDNTDHNVATLDGHQTFHCLGGIAIYTPEYDISYEGGSKKLTAMPPASSLAKQKQIKIIPSGKFNCDGLRRFEYVAVNNLKLGQPPQLPFYYSAYLWAKCLEVPKVPSWRGFMEVISSDITFSTSHIECLPFINEVPSKLTTLNSSLHYALQETKKLNQKTCFVTYDQPLYWKAQSLKLQEENGTLKNVKILLGGFHLLMSYLGAIGHIMDGSGLDDLWSVIYAPDSVKKMLSGHAFARALRAHVLTFTALGVIICRDIQLSDVCKTRVKEIYQQWKINPPQMGDLNTDTTVRQLTELFLLKLDIYKKTGPTAKLWIQYFHAVTLALQFIEAERLGNWTLHLKTISEMLPLFHAAGHYAYAKSAQMYLQDMANLENDMDPDEYDKFTSNFTSRRSDKCWSAVSSDMLIEQTLNRFFGTDLKHGRGVTPSVVARYLLGMQSSFTVMQGLEDYAGIETTNSEQHVDLTKSRTNNDDKDIHSFLFWLEEHRPFESRTCLMSLSTGIIGGSNIDCHNAFEKGKIGMASMVGKSADTVSLSSVGKVKNLAAAKSGMHLDNYGTLTAVDPLLLFQRISVLVQSNTNLTRKALQYELSPFPLSLFDQQGMMRKTPKSELFKIFKTSHLPHCFLSNCRFVIDGGWLLHQVPWPHSKLYVEICQIYLNYIIKHFGSNAAVVFDGYNNDFIGVKSYERYRRKEKVVAADVSITEDTLITLTQKKLLSNVANKLKFVNMLSAYLRRNNIAVDVATEDADTLIVNVALKMNSERDLPVAVVGNDTDLFVLMIALTVGSDNLYFYKISQGKNGPTLYSTADHKHLQPFLLFAHAFAGCDSTSAIFNKGKKGIIAILQKNPSLQELIKVYYKCDSTVEQIHAVAEKLILYLYNNKTQENTLSIADLRYTLFTTSIAVLKKDLLLASLPPTTSALKQHAKRVYYQIQLWLGNALNPEKWGWKRTNLMLLPVMNVEGPAPQELLKLIFCGCNKDCNTNRCSCKKGGLRCTQFCKSCNGVSCENKSFPDKTIEEEEDENSTDSEENL